MHHRSGTFQLVECERCQFLYLSPRPDQQEILSFYPDDYVSYRPALYEERSLVRGVDRLRGLRQRCRAILRRKEAGDLLDVGCGTGDFLAVMRSYPGWRVRGLEPHPGAAQRARSTYGLTVDDGALDAMPYAAGSFDVVTMWDVLEHLPRPVEALRQIKLLLRPGGLVVLGLPNRDSWDARLFGPAWAGYDMPRHFSVFSAAHVGRALDLAGFSTPAILNLTGSYYVTALSGRFLLAGWSPAEQRAKLVERVIGSLPVRLALAPYTILVRALGRASIMTVIAERSER